MDRVITTSEMENDIEIQRTLRPRCFKEYIGQVSLKEKMSISIEAAKKEEDLLIIFFYTDLRG